MVLSAVYRYRACASIDSLPERHAAGDVNARGKRREVAHRHIMADSANNIVLYLASVLRKNRAWAKYIVAVK